MRTRPDYIAPQDLKFVKVDPDPNFDPVHNAAVIEKTIQDNERLIRERNKGALEGVKERNNALAIYLRSINQGGKTTDYQKFFGRKYLAYLRGKEIMDKLKEQMAIRGRNNAFFVIEPSENSKQKIKKLISKGAI